MKPNTISLRRRNLMIAGVAGAAAPMASALAGECSALQQDAQTLAQFYTAQGRLVVSGRVVDGACRPVAGAAIDVLHPDVHGRVSAVTDGDGRFVLTTLAPPARGGRPQPLAYRVSPKSGAPMTSQLHFARRRGTEAVAQLQRDHEGTWRTTFALSIA